MPELPIYPDSGKEAPGYVLARRLQALSDVPSASLGPVLDELRLVCAVETLGLTGAPVSREEVARAARGEERDSELAAHVRSVLEGLELVERGATEKSDLDLDHVVSVHRAAHPAEDGSLRTSDRRSQFAGARPSDPRFVRPRLENLLEWLASESCRSMFPAERMALWFARFVEIAPFEHGNFRTAHLLASHFALASGFPPIALRLEDAEAIRSDVERAIRFDTLPLVERFTDALSRALGVLESASRS